MVPEESCNKKQHIKWACLAKGFIAPAMADKRLDPGCWLKSVFESPQRQLVLSLFEDPISYESFTTATVYVPCLD